MAPVLAPLLKTRLGKRYYEPFLGGGAMFFELEPSNALLSDINEELINAYQMVWRHPKEILTRLQEMKVDPVTYYKVRAERPNDPLERAVRFIYLNRTCYGGIYRTNRQGEFNVPYGGGSRTPTPLWEKGILLGAHEVLQRTRPELRACDFEEAVNEAGEGDVVYCDPTYATDSRNHFDRYTDRVFSWDDQTRLARACNRAFERGALVVISNVYSSPIKDLYPTGVFIQLAKKKQFGRRLSSEEAHLEYLVILDPVSGGAQWHDVIASRIARKNNSRIHENKPLVRVAS